MGQAFAMDLRSPEGRATYSVVHNQFNENRKHLNGDKAVAKTTAPALINGDVVSSRILFDDSYVGRMSRPKILNTLKLKEVMGDNLIDNPNVDQIRFIAGTEPEMKHLYELSDDQLKKMIDAGLYGNPRFEQQFNKLMQDESVEFENPLTFYSLDGRNDEGQIVPVVVVDANRTFTERVTSTESTFADVLDHVLDLSIELRGDDVVIEAPVTDEFDNEREVFVDDEFLQSNILQPVDEPAYQVSFDNDQDDEFVLTDEIEDEDYKESTVSRESIVNNEDGGLFGETTEDERIRNLKEARPLPDLKKAGYAGSRKKLEQDTDIEFE